jgi:hypothetical protein
MYNVSINPIIQSKTRLISHPIRVTKLVSEVGLDLLIDWIKLWTEDGSGSLYCQPANMEQMLQVQKAMQEKMDANQVRLEIEINAIRENIETN